MKTKITMLLVVLMMSIISVGHAGTYNVNTCAGTAVTIGNPWTGGFIYVWNTMPVQYGMTITVNPPTNLQYIVTVLDSQYSVLGADTFNVTVNPLPYIGISSTGGNLICPGGNVQLIANSSPTPLSSYQWNIGATTQTITAQPIVSPTTYTVTGTDNNGCTAVANYTVYIQPVPIAYQITGNTTYCPNQFGVVMGLSGSEPNAIYYLYHNGLQIGTALGTGNPVSFGMIANANGAYTATGEYTSLSCSINMLGTLVVNPSTLPGPAGTINGPTAMCLGSGNQTYSTIPISGATSYTWACSNGNIISGQGTTNVLVNWNGNGTLSVAGTNSCGNGPSSLLNVTIHSQPIVSLSPTNPHICTGQSVTLTATGATTYSWSGPNGMGTGNTYTASSAGQVSVIGISQFGCLSQPATTTVYVEPTPTFTALGPNGPVCEGSPLQLLANANPPSTYSWTGSNGFTSNQQNPVILNVSSANAGTYLVTATTQWGCQNTGQIIVTVNPTPIVSVSAISPICAGQTLQLICAHTGNYIAWSGPNGFTSNQQNPVIPNASSANAGWYVATTWSGSCSAKDSVWVQINSSPTINISASSLTVCGGQSVTLTATGANTYTWSTGQTGSTVLVYPTQSTMYTVVGTNQYGCTGSQSIQITVGGNVLQSQFTSAGMVTCPDGNDGWANISPLNGNYPYSYTWSPTPINGQGSNAVTGLQAGIWYVTITDANGCQGTNSVTITEPPAITITPIINGSMVTAMVTGGTLLPGDNYQYNWMPSPAFGQGTATATFAPGISIVTLTVTDGHYCQESLVINLATAGIGDDESANFSIYPNPVSDLLHIETGDLKVAGIQLYDALGKILYSGKETSISMIEFPTGMYLINVTDENGRIFRSKVVKK